MHTDDVKTIEEGWPKLADIPGTDAWYESLGICPTLPSMGTGALVFCELPSGHPGCHEARLTRTSAYYWSTP